MSETARNVQESTVRMKEVHGLALDGEEMTVETMLIVEHGYTLAGTKNYSTGKDIFKKTAPWIVRGMRTRIYHQIDRSPIGRPPRHESDATLGPIVVP